MTRNWFPVLILLLVHLSLLTNTRFTLWPEMVVYPYLLNHGFQLYTDIVNPYPPLLTESLSNFARLLGYQPLPYQILTWFLILLTDILIYKIAKDIYKKTSYAIESLIFFLFTSVAFAVNGLWFDLVQTPLILFSFFFFQKYINDKRPGDLMLSSIFLTLAFFIKQQIVWLATFYFAALILKFKSGAPKLLYKNYYVLLPFLILLLLLGASFKEFFYWVFYFPFLKASQMPGYVQLPTLKQIAIFLTLIFIFTPTIFKGSFQSRLYVFAAFCLILFAYPRFAYFHLIPSLSLLALTFGENINLSKKATLPLKSITVIGLITVTLFTARYMSLNWTHEIRFFEHDILETSRKIQEIAKSDESIYIQNGPDQILPLSGRLPTKPWADDFPWYLELGNTQTNVLNGLKVQDPKYVISKPYDQNGKFDLSSYRPSQIADYIESQYKNSVQISDTLWLKEKI